MKTATLSPKQSLFGFALLLCIAFLLGTAELLPLAILTELAEHFQVPVTHISLMVSLFALCYALCTPLLSVALQKRQILQSFFLLLLAFFAFALLTYLSFLQKNFWPFFFSRLLTACLCGVLLAFCLQLLSFLQVPWKNSFSIALLFSGFSLSALLALPFFQKMANQQNLAGAFLVNVLCISFSALTLLGLFRKQLFSATHVAAKSSTVLSWKEVGKENLAFLSNKTVQKHIFFSVTFPASCYMLYTYLSPLIKETLAFSSDFLSVYLIFFGFLSLLSGLLSSEIFPKKSNTEKLKILSLSFALLLFCLFVSFLFQQKYGAMFFLSFLGIYIYLINVPLQEIFEQESEKHFPLAKNLASSIYSLSFNLGIALGAFLAGLIYFSPWSVALSLFAALLCLASYASLCSFKKQ